MGEVKVYVVTGLELGWDNVVGVFDYYQYTIEQLTKVFPEDQFIIEYYTMANLEEYE